MYSLNIINIILLLAIHSFILFNYCYIVCKVIRKIIYSILT